LARQKFDARELAMAAQIGGVRIEAIDVEGANELMVALRERGVTVINSPAARPHPQSLAEVKRLASRVDQALLQP
jgi:tripartite-type tricarboxylate transporter receptor subunit TctC